METLIVKENRNELIKSDLKFRLLINKSRYDFFIYDKYSDAKSRLNKLKNIFKHSSFEILVLEND